MTDTPRVLRHKKDGFIYWWTPELAGLPELEEIPYEKAFPPAKEPTSDTLTPAIPKKLEKKK